MKNWMRKALTHGGLLLSLGAMPGCLVVDDDDDGAAPVGTLEVLWTIDGVTDEFDCVDFGVDRMELQIYDGGRLVDEFEPFCEDFGISIDLFDGIYDGTATLIDSFDNPVAVPEPLEAIDIVAGTTLTIDVDFPLGSFL